MSSNAASAAQGHDIVSMGAHKAHPVAAGQTRHCQWRCRRNRRYVICTTISGIRRFQSCDFKHGLFMYMPRICRCEICDPDPRKGEWMGQRRVSSLDWPFNPTRQPQRRCCIGMQQRRRMAIVSAPQIQIRLWRSRRHFIYLRYSFLRTQRSYTVKLHS